MMKVYLNLWSVLVLLAIASKSVASFNISYQIGEFNNKLNYLQGRLDLFDYITEGNVSVLLHRVEMNESKYAENVTIQMIESNRKLNNLEDKIDSHDAKLNALEGKVDSLATAVATLFGDIKKLMFKPLASCIDAFANLNTNRGSGIYNIQPISNSAPFDAYCMADAKGGLPWTVVQRRVDGSVNFYRNWTEYQRGFGDVQNNFFIGLDKLHTLTTQGEPQELWVMLTDPNGITAHAYYDNFAIGNEMQKYPLDVLGKYSGDAGDSLIEHKGRKFSTYDNDNDEFSKNCAESLKSAWWFSDCVFCQLNGVYGSTKYEGGINWYHFRGDSVSLKYAHMAIRPVRK